VSRARSILGASLATLAVGIAGLAWSGGFETTKHGDPAAGVLRVDGEPRGECTQCHEQHASLRGTPTGGPFPFLLFAPNDNALCVTCHSGEGTLAIYPGSPPWEQSTHALSGRFLWPGPTPPGRPSSDTGKCLNCHDPHGARDAAGLIPSMLVAREERLCLSCHDGSPAPDVRTQIQKPFAHPIGLSGRHAATEGDDASRYGVGSRHAECVDCHNPHFGASDPLPPAAPNASNRSLGVGRVRVTNGPAGTRPIYTWAGPGERSFAAEYEVCFKCHSSWTTRPVGQSDLALLTNPNNPSYHPVQARGKNAGIDSRSFVTGWSSDRLTYCSDCHSSDDPLTRGPHGSNYRYLLKASYAATSVPTPMAPSDLCFECHTWDTYADPSAASASLAASRFNPPAVPNGHAFHIGQQGLSCYACHESHGSTLRPALIATGRSPGLSNYTQTLSGGTCAMTCHTSSSYTLNYPR